MSVVEKTHRRFTQAARAAAALARQRKREHRAQFPQQHQFVMVVVRALDVPRSFAWQIRRFGRLEPVERSSAVFSDPAAAARSGQAALDGWMDVLAADPSA